MHWRTLLATLQLALVLTLLAGQPAVAAPPADAKAAEANPADRPADAKQDNSEPADQPADEGGDPADEPQADAKSAEPRPDKQRAGDEQNKKNNKGAAKKQAKPAPEEPEQEDSEPPSDEQGDKETADEPADKDPSESTDEPKHSEVQWDDEVAAVLEKDYPQNVADLKLIQQQTQRVIDHALPAVVSVRVGQAFGSAVIVSPEGLVLTAGHVVGKPGLPVTFIFADGTTAKGKTLGMYREIDSGMMQITDPGPWPYVETAEPGDIKTGQWVVAIGQPGGFDRERTPPVRLGRVLFANDDVISTDCTLVGGDSGGPLFNMHGDVVGIHSRIGRRITDNFHVPISTYRTTWDRLAAGESWGAALAQGQETEARPLLGVTGDPRAEECELSQVFPNMPAAQAGLKRGDVVRKFNGKLVSSFDDLVRLVYGRQPGDTVKLVVVRGDETIDVELRLGIARAPLPGSPPLPEKSDEAEKSKSGNSKKGKDQQ